jgi:general secretion pathway protein A
MIENRDVLEEIRALIDFMADYDYKFSVVFFGLPVMEGKLATDEPLYHRVEARVVLRPLPNTEAVKSYIKHRLKIAGSAREVFSDEAYHVIYQSTKGNPRLVNIVCDNALTEGYLSKEKIVGQKEVDRIIVEMGYNTRLKTLFLDSSRDECPS